MTSHVQAADYNEGLLRTVLNGGGSGGKGHGWGESGVEGVGGGSGHNKSVD